MQMDNIHLKTCLTFLKKKRKKRMKLTKKVLTLSLGKKPIKIDILKIWFQQK